MLLISSDVYHCIVFVSLYVIIFWLDLDFSSALEYSIITMRRYTNSVYYIIIMNVMELFSVVEGALLDRPCMVFQRVCVVCL